MNGYATNVRGRNPSGSGNSDLYLLLAQIADKSVDRVSLARPRLTREKDVRPSLKYVQRLGLCHVTILALSSLAYQHFNFPSIPPRKHLQIRNDACLT